MWASNDMEGTHQIFFQIGINVKYPHWFSFGWKLHLHPFEIDQDSVYPPLIPAFKAFPILGPTLTDQPQLVDWPSSREQEIG